MRPSSCHFFPSSPPPADVGHRVHEAAVHQAEHVRVERGRHRGAVGAVGVEQRRVAAVAREVLAGQDPHRDLHAVRRGGGRELDPVLRGVEPAEHRDLLEQRPLPRRGIVVVDGRGRDGRLVREAEHLRVELAVAAQGGEVGGLRELDPVGRPAPQVRDAQVGLAALALEQHGVVLEEPEGGEHHVLAVGLDLLPARTIGAGDRRRHDPEVPARVVGANPELPLAMLDVVLLVGDARGDHLHLGGRAVGGEEAHLGRRQAPGLDEEELPVERLRDPDVEPLVLLLVDEVVLRRPEDVPEDLVGALRLRVLDRVVEALAVLRPLDGGDALGRVRRDLPRAQVLDVKAVLAEPRLVRGVGEEVPVRAHRVGPEGHELLALRELVQVEHHLLRRVERALPAAEDRVLPTRLRARVVEEAALAIGHVRVRLLDAREHLVVEPLLQRLRRLHEGLGVGQLGIQVALHLRRPLVAHPEVVVHEGVAVDRGRVRVLLRHRRAERFRRGRGGGGLREGERAHGGGDHEGQEAGQTVHGDLRTRGEARVRSLA